MDLNRPLTNFGYRIIALIGAAMLLIRAMLRRPVNLYRHARLMLQLPGVIEALNHSGVRYMVAGGLSYEAVRGRITRLHKDLDLTIDANDLGGLRASLEQIGFRYYRDRLCSCYFLRPGMKIDVFMWETQRSHHLRMIDTFEGSLCLRVPCELFKSTNHKLVGLSLHVQPLWIARMFKSLARSKADVRLLETFEPPEGYGFVETKSVESFPVDLMALVHLPDPAR